MCRMNTWVLTESLYIRCRDYTRSECDLAVSRGELYGVRSDVCQHLRETTFVRKNHLVDSRIINIHAKAHPVFLSRDFHHGLDSVKTGGQRKGRLFKSVLDMLKARAVKYVVDEAKQMRSTLLDSRDMLPLPVCEFRAVKNIGKPYNAPQRGARFMRHGGDEIRFGSGETKRLLMLTAELGVPLVHVDQSSSALCNLLFKF
mmetsp:Transcript_7364/g.14653  ORF Transcript_7364/g.14653 Transcript_7364/m.14653 type:complete len:201 (-) Transcript_7364:1151-1753(-)